MNKGVGLVAFSLPFALLAVSFLGGTCGGINSISHYYFTRPGGDILVGALCVIGTLLTFLYKLPSLPMGGVVAVDGYLGHGIWDIRAARFAGLCAFGVAFFPASAPGCEDLTGSVARVFLQVESGGEGLPVSGQPGFDFWASLGVTAWPFSYVHYASALGMFAVLAYFSLVVFTRPQSSRALRAGKSPERLKRRRNDVYRTCGGLIVVAILALVYNAIFNQDGTEELAAWNRANLTFWFEALGLVAFGLSWSIKGRLFGFLRDPGEDIA